jgi:hypothetical protein
MAPAAVLLSAASTVARKWCLRSSTSSSLSVAICNTTALACARELHDGGG